VVDEAHRVEEVDNALFTLSKLGKSNDNQH
jgi:hypothetical protein